MLISRGKCAEYLSGAVTGLARSEETDPFYPFYKEYYELFKK